MTKSLPAGWVICNLEDIADGISYGFTAKSNPNSGNARMLRITDIQERKVNWETVPFCEISPCDKEKYLLKKLDLVFARTGATVGKSFLIQENINDLVFASYLIRVRMIESEMAKFLSRFFDSTVYWKQITEFSSGIGQPNVNGSKLKGLKIPLPPLNEQKRIADKLDSILARVDACRERLDRIPAILKRFRQAVLTAATSGKLTEEWRGTSETKEWVTMPLAKICLSITDGDHQAPPQAENGIPFITISAISNGRLGLEKASRFVPLYYFNALKENRRPQRGDVLYSVTGSIGIPVLVDTDSSFVFQRHISILKPDYSKITSDYLKYAMGTDNTQKQAHAIATGTAQLTIPLNGLRSLLIDIPPLKEQTEIIRRVEELFAYADRIEARYQAARTRVDKLTPAILAKAFRGELVPQDPSDEPASVLLERIRAADAITPKPRRSRNPAAK